MEIEYKIYDPSGNITALVIGDNYTKEQKMLINNEIMKNEKNVEQVGFLSTNSSKITMAGGEFCGNAIRCASMYYMDKQKEMNIQINNLILKTGIDEEQNIWSEIPIDKTKIIKLNEDIYEVILEGITILVTDLKKLYKDNLKENAKTIMNKYKISDEAVGVIFKEKTEKSIKIYPVVWVRDIDTLFLENSCSSGTIATTMVESFLGNDSKQYSIMQPSGDVLKTSIIQNDKIILKGKIKTDDKIRTIGIRKC